MAESVGREGLHRHYQLPNAWARGSGKMGSPCTGREARICRPSPHTSELRGNSKISEKGGTPGPIGPAQARTLYFHILSIPDQGLENLDGNARGAAELPPWTSMDYYFSSSALHPLPTPQSRSTALSPSLFRPHSLQKQSPESRICSREGPLQDPRPLGRD